jgi:HEAT repeat protein
MPGGEAERRIEEFRKLALDTAPGAAAELRSGLSDPDETVRRLALYGLERLGDPESAPDILPLLDDEEVWVRLAAAGALGRLGNRCATARLSDLLEADDPRLRLAAFTALGRIGDPASQRAILAALKDERNWSELSIAGQLSILHIVEQDWFTDGAVVEVLRWLLSCPDWDHPELVDLEESRRTRFPLTLANKAAEILAAKFGDTSGEGRLIDGLGLMYQQQQSSARALGAIKSKAAVPALMELLGAPGKLGQRRSCDVPTSLYALGALGEIGDVAAVPLLEEFLQDEDAKVRRAAADALEKTDGRKHEPAPDGPAASVPAIPTEELGTPGGRRPPQFIVIGVDDCTSIAGLETMLEIAQTLAGHGQKVVYTMWVAPLSGDLNWRDVSRQKLLLQRLFDLGSEVAHHTLHHNPGGHNWASLPREVQIEEIEGCTRWYRENIEGFTRPFSHKGGGGGRGERVDPEFTEQLLARQDFLYRGFCPSRFSDDYPNGMHPDEVRWPRKDDPLPYVIETCALDANAPPMHRSITHGIQGDIPGQFDREIPEGVAMMKANLDYLYNHPRRPILAVNAYHDWGLKSAPMAADQTHCHRNEGAILRQFLLDVLVDNLERYPDTYCVTFRQVIEYVLSDGDLEHTLAVGNCQDSRHPVRPCVE